MLKLTDVDTHYGPLPVLKSVSLEVRVGEIVCLLGGNASGKSTTMKTILDKPAGSEAPGRVTNLNLSPDGNRLLYTIADGAPAPRVFMLDLNSGAFTRQKAPAGEVAQDFERVWTLFPRLKERQHQLGGTLSGGEQQMLAIGRALMARPRLLLMDEPSMGLAPVLVDQVFDIIRAINGQGTTILVVEQNAPVALSIATRGYVLQNGRIVIHDTAQTLLATDSIRRAYLGED